MRVVAGVDRPHEFGPSRQPPGGSRREIARETGRTENAIRWTPKRALAKTDSARQADFVRLVMQSPPRS